MLFPVRMRSGIHCLPPLTAVCRSFLPRVVSRDTAGSRRTAFFARSARVSSCFSVCFQDVLPLAARPFLLSNAVFPAVFCGPGDGDLGSGLITFFEGGETPLLRCRRPFLRRNGHGPRPPVGSPLAVKRARPFRDEARKGVPALPPQSPPSSPKPARNIPAGKERRFHNMK